MPFVAAYDAGGTSIKVAIVDEHLQIVGSANSPSSMEGQPYGYLVEQAILSAIEDAHIKDEDLRGIAGSQAGIVRSDGVLIFAPNVDGLADYDIGAYLKGRFGVPFFHSNDGNMAALGTIRQDTEIRSRGIDNVIYVILGTGVGAGLYLDGKLYTGQTGLAGELGHWILDPSEEAELCGCGNRGCWEAYCSGPGLARMARKARAAGNYNWTCITQDIQSPVKLFDYADCNDPLAIEVLARFNRFNVQAVNNMIMGYEPGAIIFGEGMVNGQGERILGPLRKGLEKMLLKGYDMPLIRASIIERPGLTGAMIYGVEHYLN